MSIIGYLKIADFFTIGNLFCGTLSILFAGQGRFELSALIPFQRSYSMYWMGKLPVYWIRKISSASRSIPWLTLCLLA